MSDNKKQVLQALLKSMRSLMKDGHADEAMAKPDLSDALDEAKEEAMEVPVDEEECEVEPVVAKVKAKPVMSISITAIKKGMSKPAPKPVAPAFPKKK